MNNCERLVKNVKSWPRRAGKAELSKHLQGEQLTRAQAIKAKCYECTGGEHVKPCTVIGCALTQYSPFNKNGDETETEIEN